MNELLPDPELNANKISYVYDKYDRMYIKNYYVGTVGRGRQKGARASKQTIFVGQRKPKKLLYQDVYRYKDNHSPDFFRIDRIYQPVISPVEIFYESPGGYPKTKKFRSFITCKSPILGSGFIFFIGNSGNRQSNLLRRTLYPDWDVYNPASGNTNTDIILFPGDSGLGEITGQHTKTIPGPAGYSVKAFCTIETGVLFSPSISLSI